MAEPDAIDPIFQRSKFLLRQKLLAISEKYTVGDESGKPVLFVERPAHLLRGLAALFACIPFIHLAIGIGFLTGAISVNEGEAALAGGVFIGVALTFILIGWTVAGCLIGAGRSIKKRRRHTFCQAVSVISCLWMPLGTILGVFSLMVLNRPSVKAQFGKV